MLCSSAPAPRQYQARAKPLQHLYALAESRFTCTLTQSARALASETQGETARARSSGRILLSSSEGNRKPGFRFLEERGRADSSFYRVRGATVVAVANCLVRTRSALSPSVLWGKSSLENFGCFDHRQS